jgi:hypothetical protein
MSDDYQRRIDRIRKLLSDIGASSGPNGFMAIHQPGGLAPYATIAQDDLNNEWIRTMGAETEEDFCRRAATESRDSGAKLCHISSMPGPHASEALIAAAKAASDYYYEHEYPDVPPVEATPWNRPSRLGYAG